MVDPIQHTSRSRAAQGIERREPRRSPARHFSHDPVRERALERRALGLGWFSIGLGLAELVAPRQMARLIGADEEDGVTRALMMATGTRELACGLGLLSKSRPAFWAWARFAGDVMDLALLGHVWSTNPVPRERMLGVGGAVLGATWADAETALQLGAASVEPLADGVSVQQAITVQKTAEEAYTFFRDLEHLPSFMWHLESVVEENGRSRWRAKGPLGTSIEWEAEVVEDRPGECIAWRSLPGADVPNRGRVTFTPAPGGLGTEIGVELSYDPPAGALGVNIAKLFGSEPSQQVSADLRRLKQVLETGEVLHSDASIHRGMHPARPALLAQTTSLPQTSTLPQTSNGKERS